MGRHSWPPSAASATTGVGSRRERGDVDSAGVDDVRPRPVAVTLLRRRYRLADTTVAVPSTSVLVASLAVAACALALAGCGGAGGSIGTTASGSSNAGLRFAECMRSHGVPNFPDQGASGGGFQRKAGTNPRSPAFQGAQKACQHILGNRPGEQAPTAVQKAAALKFAGCMRLRGVPNFPDPRAPTSGITAGLFLDGMVFPISSSIDPQSPAFQRAAAACGLGQAGGNPKRG